MLGSIPHKSVRRLKVITDGSLSSPFGYIFFSSATCKLLSSFTSVRLGKTLPHTWWETAIPFIITFQNTAGNAEEPSVRR